MHKWKSECDAECCVSNVFFESSDISVQLASYFIVSCRYQQEALPSTASRHTPQNPLFALAVDSGIILSQRLHLTRVVIDLQSNWGLPDIRFFAACRIVLPQAILVAFSGSEAPATEIAAQIRRWLSWRRRRRQTTVHRGLLCRPSCCVRRGRMRREGQNGWIVLLGKGGSFRSSR